MKIRIITFSNLDGREEVRFEADFETKAEYWKRKYMDITFDKICEMEIPSTLPIGYNLTKE